MPVEYDSEVAEYSSVREEEEEGGQEEEEEREDEEEEARFEAELY